MPIPFHELMLALLKHYQLPTEQVSQAQEVYTLHFDGQPDVHLVSKIGSPYIDVMTEAAQLGNLKAAEPLLALHELNGCGLSDPPVVVSVQRNGGSVIAWGRQSRQLLDLEGFSRLLQQVQKQAEKARKILAQQKNPNARQAETASRLMTLLR